MKLCPGLIAPRGPLATWKDDWTLVPSVGLVENQYPSAEVGGVHVVWLGVPPAAFNAAVACVRSTGARQLWKNGSVAALRVLVTVVVTQARVRDQVPDGALATVYQDESATAGAPGDELHKVTGRLCPAAILALLHDGFHGSPEPTPVTVARLPLTAIVTCVWPE